MLNAIISFDSSKNIILAFLKNLLYTNIGIIMKVKNFLLSSLKYVYAICFLITMVIIFIKAGESGEVSATQSSNLADYLQNNFKPIENLAQKSEDFPTLVRKFIGHYGLFALNGFFAYLTYFSFSKTSVHAICFSALTAILISTVSELIQGSVEGRFASLTDGILNVQGFVSGCGISILLTYLSSKKRSEILYVKFVSFITFLSFVLLSLFFYLTVTDKTESIEFCTIVEIIVTSIWFIIDGVILLTKLIKSKKTLI